LEVREGIKMEKMHIAYIGIGSNLGDREKNCREAVRLVGECKDVRILATSKWRQTLALRNQGGLHYGRSSCRQNSYINGAIKIETVFSPRKLLIFLQGVEASLGRVRTGVKWEDRNIDLDILFYDDLVIDEPELKIPHPELHKRMFVLEPLCDIEPEFVHPVFNKNVEQLRSGLTGDEARSRR